MATRWRRLAAATTIVLVLTSASSAGFELKERAPRMQFFCNTGSQGRGDALPLPPDDARSEAVAVPARIRDAQALLEQALELLPAEHRPTRPAVLVMQHASPKLLKLTEGTCAAVLGSEEVQPTIFVRWDCPLLEKAQQQGAIYLRALAAVLAHESSHVRGLDEVEARELELKVFAGLVRKLSGTEWQIAQEYRGILVRRLQIQRSRQ